MSKQRGFGLMLAIFLVVTLAAMGVYLLTVSTGQIEAATQDEQGARAYQAARAGIDWGAYQVILNPGGIACAAPPAGATQTLTLQQGLSGFYVQVNCQSIGSESEAGSSVVVRLLQATGCNASPCCPAGTACGPTYVERQLELTLTQ